MRHQAVGAGPPSESRLLEAARAEVAASATTWFPGLDGTRLRIRVRRMAARPRCYLYEVTLDDGGTSRAVVLKVRHSVPSLRRIDRFEERPILTPQRTLPDRETAQREYDGLWAVSAALAGRQGESFGVLRPLAWLPEHAAILMDHVGDPTLHDRLLTTSRLTRRRAASLADEPWYNAGSWLRIFHDHGETAELPTRIGTRDEVAALYDAYADFLMARGSRAELLRELRRRGASLAEAALPRELPLAPGHGDFVDSNMFVAASGQVTVFDPLPLWKVPRYQDLATIVVGVRTHSLQATSQGRAFAASDLARYERALLAGYFGTDVPLAAVRAYELLVVLDRWATMVSKRARHGRVRPVLHAARKRLAVRHVEQEARRVLTDLVDLAG